MKIAIDFDGVICKRQGIPTKAKWSDPAMPGAKESINLLIQEGHEVFVLTANKEIDKVVKWLKRNKFPEIAVLSKPRAQVYIDDRAMRFTDWQDIRKYFS